MDDAREWTTRDSCPWLATWQGSLLYHLYNQTSYMALSGISPLTYSICNTVKRVVVGLPALPSSFRHFTRDNAPD